MASDDEMMLAIRQCPSDAIGALLGEYFELVDGRLDGISALLQACFLGREDVARAIAKRRRAIDVFEAAALGEVERLTELLDGNPSLADAVTADGNLPLGIAAFFGRPAAVGLLLARGAAIDLPSRDSTRAAPLHAAVAGRHADTVALLLDKGAAVDARQQGGFTPLMAASHRADLAIVDLLLAHGADPRLADDGGRTAIDHAAASGHAELARRMEQNSLG